MNAIIHPKSIRIATVLAIGLAALAAGLAGLAFGLLAPPPALAQQPWVRTAPMPSAHRFAGAALLPSGRVLVAGGGSAFDTHTTDAALFDPATGAWRPAAALPRAHRYHEQMRTLSTGEVLFVGDDTYGAVDALAHLYNEGAAAWSLTASSPIERRFQSTLTELAGGRRLLYAGGYGGGQVSSTFDTAELYDVATRTWIATGALATPRLGHTAMLLTVGPNAGRVLVAGGTLREDGSVHRSAELYDPATGLWGPAAAMNEPRVFHTATRLPSGGVLVTGGEHDGPNSATAEIYDPALDRWRAVAPMDTPRSRHSATLLRSGQVLVAGGGTVRGFDSPSAGTELFDPATGTWSDAGRLNDARTAHTATLLATGQVLVAGGVGTGGAVLNSAELFDLAVPNTTPTATSTTLPTATGTSTATPTVAATSTAMPTATSTPTATATSTATPPPPAPPACTPRLCPRLGGYVPQAPIAAALANPAAVEGFCRPRNPALPLHPFYNPPRVWLTLVDFGKPFHPVFNGLVFRAGCQ